MVAMDVSIAALDVNTVGVLRVSVRCMGTVGRGLVFAHPRIATGVFFRH